jgi:hypothetical protein
MPHNDVVKIGFPTAQASSSVLEGRPVLNAYGSSVKNVFDSVAILGAIVFLAAILSVTFWCVHELL